MKNKKILILLGIGALILLLVIALIIKQLRYNNSIVAETNKPAENFQADFLSASEKQNLSLTTDLKVQALKRNAQGDVMVYKIIRNESDVIDPATIKPISPRTR